MAVDAMCRLWAVYLHFQSVEVSKGLLTFCCKSFYWYILKRQLYTLNQFHFA